MSRLNAVNQPALPLLACDQRQYSYTKLADKLAISDFTSLLTELYNIGYVTFNN
jgi:hypothetical protein